MKFLDRHTESAILRDHLTRPGAGLFVLYGRRRIGKTALLDEVLRGIPRAAYHVGTRSTIDEELRRLSATLAQAWDSPVLGVQPLASTEALVAWLESLREPSVLVFDELPYLAESDASLPGQLQAAWDRRLANGSLKIVCCGSSVSVMEDMFFGKRSPLFGRRTGQLRLGPLPTAALAEVFPPEAASLIELAATFGGVPGYLQRLDPAASLEDNLRRHVLARGEPLYEEIPFLLREELREPRVYFAILATVASGSHKFGEIASKVGLDRANLTRYLGVLADLGLLRRTVPLSEEAPDKSKKGVYRIADPFVATWFTLVHPFRDSLERGRVDPVIAEIRAALKSHLPHAVEPVITELLAAGVLPFSLPFRPGRIGRQWSPTGEFDLVILDDTETQAVVGEVKWSETPRSASVLDELERRVAKDPWLSTLRTTCVVISRSAISGVTASDSRLIDLSQLTLPVGPAGQQV